MEPRSKLAGSLTYLSLEHIESNTGKILREPEDRVQDEGISTSFAFDNRHVLYGKLRPYLNKVALPDFRGRCTTEIIPLLPADGVDRDFLCRILRRQETVEVAMQGKTGSRMPRADMDELLTLSVPLPPLPEQKRIASILNEQMSAVEKARSAAEAQLEAAKALPAAYLRQAFPQPGQPLPAGWRWVRLGDVCEAVTGGTPPRSEPHYFTGKIPWLKPEHLDLNIVVTESTEYLTDEGARRVGLLPAGSVLVSCIGKIGKTAIAGVPLTTNQQINSLIPGPSVDSMYLYFCCRGIREELERAASTALVPILNKSTFAAIKIPLPTLPEQKRIGATLSEQMSAMNKLRAGLESQLAEINALPPALLRQAFNGEL